MSCPTDLAEANTHSQNHNPQLGSTWVLLPKMPGKNFPFPQGFLSIPNEPAFCKPCPSSSGSEHFQWNILGEGTELGGDAFTVNHCLRNHPKLWPAELPWWPINCPGHSMISRTKFQAEHANSSKQSISLGWWAFLALVLWEVG